MYLFNATTIFWIAVLALIIYVIKKQFSLKNKSKSSKEVTPRSTDFITFLVFLLMLPFQLILLLILGIASWGGQVWVAFLAVLLLEFLLNSLVVAIIFTDFRVKIKKNLETFFKIVGGWSILAIACFFYQYLIITLPLYIGAIYYSIKYIRDLQTKSKSARLRNTSVKSNWKSVYYL